MNNAVRGEAHAAAPLAPADVELLLHTIKDLAYVRTRESVLAIVSHSVRELVGSDGTTFVLREGPLVHYAEENAIGPLWKGRRFPATACISGWAMIHGQSVAIEDITVDPRIPQEAYRSTFVKSLLMVPVRREDPVAAIGAYWANAHNPTDREIRLLESLADAVATAMANAEAWERTEKALKSRDEFLTMASHELRTPLTPLLLRLGGLERLLTNGRNPAAALAEVHQLGNHVARMARLVDYMIEMSRTAAGPYDLARETVLLDSVVTPVVEDHRRAAREAGSPLAVTVEEGLAGLWDRECVTRILQTLVSNAIKYGEGKPISIDARRDGDAALITVQDNGMGIDSDAQSRIFGRFERAASPLHFGGFGMGLWLAKQLAEAHGGRIDVTSAPGKGASFSVSLPLEPIGMRRSGEQVRASA